MAFGMKFSQTQLSGIEPVPAGIYDVIFVEFTPKHSKPNAITGNVSVNLNAKVKILGHPEWEKDRYLFASLNEGIPSFIQDFVHSFGIPMEEIPGTEEVKIPGNFNGDENDPSSWKYEGPLTSRTAQWEVAIKDYNGRPSQEIVRFICAVPQCAQTYPKVRHSNDMRGKK